MSDDLGIYNELLETSVYTFKYKFSKIQKYDDALRLIKDHQKIMVKDGTFFTLTTKDLEGSLIIKNLSKLALLAFNESTFNIIDKAKFNNIDSCKDRIQKKFESINKYSSGLGFELSQDILKSKFKELMLSHEFEEEKERIKQEQAELKAQMREEQKELEEAEKKRDKALEEEMIAEEALEKARAELELKNEEEKQEFLNQIKALEEKLKSAHEESERAISNAQITSVGHVYIISNIGSFGEDVYKIGMTRRDDPMDRVRELGDASVPFRFDVHALVYSENARKLESDLHEYFDSKRKNKINKRKEFFNVTIEELKIACKEIGVEIELTELAEAREFRETISLEEDIAA